jgi:hypothetical protein
MGGTSLFGSQNNIHGFSLTHNYIGPGPNALNPGNAAAGIG